MSSPCTAPGCERRAVGRGLCQLHYRRRQRGRPLEPPPQKREGLLQILIAAPPLLWDLVDTCARLAGLTRSEWVRRALMDAVRRPPSEYPPAK